MVMTVIIGSVTLLMLGAVDIDPSGVVRMVLVTQLISIVIGMGMWSRTGDSTTGTRLERRAVKESAQYAA